MPASSMRALFDFVVPRFCIHCEQHLSFEESFLCDNCLNNTPRLDNLTLIDLLYDHFGFESIAWLFGLVKFDTNSPFRSMVHQLKYKGLHNAGSYLGEVLGRELKNKMDLEDIDYIVPVPLHRLKLIERGYNQSSLISGGVSSITGIPVMEKAIKRSRYTYAQVETESRAERYSNIKGAFKIQHPEIIVGKNILIIDDVITTGSTVREMVKELKSAGAANIYAASIMVA